MEATLNSIAGIVALTLQAVSLLMVSIGAVVALARIVIPLLSRDATHGRLRAAWLTLARWLLLGLEFMLAADIVDTVISPGWEDIGQLAAIAAVRTFLNFFLERDLDAARAQVETVRP